MGEIKSTLEIALEKAQRLGMASKEEIEAEKWIGKGQRMAAKYLEGDENDLRSMIAGVESDKIPAVLRGVSHILLRNTYLPRDHDQMKRIKKALEGLLQIKGSMAAQTVSQIEQIIESYFQTRQHYYQQMKAQIQSRLGGVQQALAQQYGMAMPEGIDPEAIPEFQQEWSKLDNELREQFENQLDTLKRYLEQI